MKKNKNFILLIVGVLVILLMGYFLLSAESSTKTEQDIGTKTETQIVKLSVENGRYVMNPSTIKKDTRVKIEADMTKMPGCSRSVVISAFGVSKTLTQEDNIIEFTPNKAGTFNIACSMNMYLGSFSVLEDNGTKPAYIEETPKQNTGCNMGTNGGGCGCAG